jgi:D-amino-acid dehydrogenase
MSNPDQQAGDVSPGGSVLVVGGGVIGASCAYYLSKSGWSVTIVEANQFGSGCSHANCGLVCPSHVLPLAVPGAVRTALKALFNPHGALAIKPGFNPALWAWLFRFARRCNAVDMLEAGRAIQALLNSSRRLYDELLKEESLDCEWEARGLLFVLQSRAGMEHYTETDKLLSNSFQLPAKRLDGEALVALEPALKTGLAGGWLYETDAHLRPDKLIASWRRVLETRGVIIREGCPVQSIIQENGQARAVATSEGEMTADIFVFATGAWTSLLQRQLGCRIPIQPGKGYSITMPRPVKCPAIPLVLEEHRVAVTPMKTGYRLGSTMEFAGYDARLNRRRLELLREGARPYLHEPFCEPVEEEWYGWRPMTYDGKPIIDRCPRWQNVYIAAGHNMLGLSMAPATGKLVAEMLEGKQTHLDPAPYTLKRF